MPGDPLSFPFLGVSEDVAGALQEPGTTARAVNARAIDPPSGRSRGAQRAGLSKFTPNALPGYCRAMRQLTYDTPRVSFDLVAPASTIGSEWESTTTYDVSAVAANINHVFVASRFEVCVFTSEGDKVQAIKTNSAQEHMPVAWADVSDGSLYTVANPIDPTDTAVVRRFVRHEPQDEEDLDALEPIPNSPFPGESWEYEIPKQAPGATPIEVIDWRLDRNRLVLLIQETTPDIIYIMVLSGLRGAGPTPGATILEVPNVVFPATAHGIEVNTAGEYFVSLEDSTGAPLGSVVKMSPIGEEVWRYDGDGVNRGLCLDPDENVYTWGEGLGFFARRLIDQGDAVSDLPADGAISYLSPGYQTVARTMLRCVSGGDVVAAPYDWATTATFPGPTEHAIVRLQSDTQYAAYLYPNGNGGALSTFAVDPVEPIYPDLFDDDRAGPEFLYVGGADATDTIQKARIVTRTRAAGPPRETQVVAASGRSIVQFGRDGAIVSPAASTDIFDADARNIVMTDLFGRTYAVDGRSVFEYKPIQGDPGRVRKLTAVSGRIPTGAQLVVGWKNRLFLSRFIDAPYAWQASGVRRVRDWNLFPSVQTATQSVGHRNTIAGEVPDITNAMVPLSDDLLLFGCDHSLYVLAGDPGRGAEFDILSSTIGMAFGVSWCKDPLGAVYFYGSKGGVFRLVGGQQLERISHRRIERQLQDVDQSAYRLELQYDWRHDGVWVVQVPQASGPATADVRSWFFDTKNGGWWPDAIAHRPTATAIYDGDLPNDRLTLMVGADGFVRYVDESEASDDGTDIESSVMVGPLAVQGDMRLKVNRVVAEMGATTQAARVSIYESDTADVIPERPIDTYEVGAGRSSKLPLRARGSYLWIELSGAGQGRHWSFEAGSIESTEAGKRRAN